MECSDLQRVNEALTWTVAQSWKWESQVAVKNTNKVSEPDYINFTSKFYDQLITA